MSVNTIKVQLRLCTASITRNSNKLTALLQATDGDNTESVSILDSIKETLTKYVQLFASYITKQLSDSTDPTSGEEELLEAQNTHDDYLTTTKTSIIGFENQLAASRIGNSLPVNEQAISGTHFGFRLPELIIEPFAGEGDPLIFLYFTTAFERAVKACPGITPSQKFILLKNSLRGKAFALIEYFSITDVNFDEASQLLQSEFFYSDCSN